MDSQSNNSNKVDSPQLSPRSSERISSRKSSIKEPESERQYEVVGQISDRGSGNYNFSDSNNLGSNPSDSNPSHPKLSDADNDDQNNDVGIDSLDGDMADSDKGSQKSEPKSDRSPQRSYQLKAEADSDVEDSKSHVSEVKESEVSEEVSK